MCCRIHLSCTALQNLTDAAGYDCAANLAAGPLYERASTLPKHPPLLAIELTSALASGTLSCCPCTSKAEICSLTSAPGTGKILFLLHRIPLHPHFNLWHSVQASPSKRRKGGRIPRVPEIGHPHASDTYDAISASLTALDLTPMCCRTLRQKGSQNEVSYSINFASRYLLYLQSWSCSKTKTDRRHLLHLGRRYDQ